jgi:hypothetical protein
LSYKLKEAGLKKRRSFLNLTAGKMDACHFLIGEKRQRWKILLTPIYNGESISFTVSPEYCFLHSKF